MVDSDCTNRRPVSGFASPAPWIGRLRGEVQAMACRKNILILTGMPLVRADVADSTVPMLDFVPMHIFSGPDSGLIQIHSPGMSREPSGNTPRTG